MIDNLDDFLNFRFASLSANFNFFLLPRLNTLYLILPKCANLSIKHLLHANEKQDFSSRFKDIKSEINHHNELHASNLERLKIMIHGDAFKFTFVRNPYDRLLSCWKNKVKWPTIFEKSDEIYRSHLERLNSGFDTPRFDTLDISFGEFIEAITALSTDRMDRHWAPLYELARPDLVQYDFIDKVENYEADIQRLCEVNGWIMHSEKHLNKSHIETPAEFHDPGVRRMIFRRYENDFTAFGYKEK